MLSKLCLHWVGNPKVVSQKILSAILLFSLLLAGRGAAPAHAAPGPRFAVRSGGALDGACDTWKTACDLQWAITVALDVSAPAVWVQEGTYVPDPTNRSATFSLAAGVALYGGFAGDETELSQRDPRAHVTILSGEIGGADSGDNSYHVVTGADGATLDGFTVTGGKANGGASPNDTGGGLYNPAGTLTVANSIFDKNNTGTNGGGISNSGTLTVTNSTFSGNTTAEIHSAGEGGAIFSDGTLTITNSSFSDNSSDFGAGIWNQAGTLTIADSTFSGNTVGGGSGGGIYHSGGTATITNSTFSGNIGRYGGGIANYSTLSIADSSFDGNNTAPLTSGKGGGIITYGGLTITNSTLYGNTAGAGNTGGGIYVNDGGHATITNSTFAGNSSGVSFDDARPNIVGTGATIRNTILADSTSGDNCHSGGAFFFINGGNNIDDSITCGWGTASGSMSSTDPLLGALANNGGPTQTMALIPGSPAIDGITFNAPNSAPAVDQRGISRPQGAGRDIGAFELEQYVISGNAGVGGVTLSYTDGMSKTTASGGGGAYSLFVSSGWSGAVTPSKVDYVFVPGHKDYLTVNANLSGQNYAVAWRAGKYDDGHSGWGYTGPWVAAAVPGAYNSTLHIGTALGQYATFNENVAVGTRFYLTYLTYPGWGNIVVYLDSGAPLTTLNTNAAAGLLVYESPALSAGVHTVVLAYAGPSGKLAAFDAIEVGVTKYDDNAGGWSCTGTCMAVAVPATYHNSLHILTAGSNETFSFMGTRFDLTYLTYPGWGSFGLYLDGSPTPMATLNTDAAAGLPTYSSPALSAGPHSLVIKDLSTNKLAGFDVLTITP